MAAFMQVRCVVIPRRLCWVSVRQRLFHSFMQWRRTASTTPIRTPMPTTAILTLRTPSATTPGAVAPWTTTWSAQSQRRRLPLLLLLRVHQPLRHGAARQSSRRALTSLTSHALQPAPGTSALNHVLLHACSQRPQVCD